MALPIMLAGLSTPLLGLVDLAVIGQHAGADSIGAIAIAALIFSFLYWGFGFLRMGTTGITAQAFGAANKAEIGATLGRALMIALVAGSLLCLCAGPVKTAALFLLGADAEVNVLVAHYFDIRIFSAPATLMHYAAVGWFLGLGSMRMALILQIVLNLTNLILDAYFVLVLDLGVAGVAAGTLIAEWFATFIALGLALRRMRQRGYRWPRGTLLSRDAFVRLMSLNRDIMIRSLALIFVFAWFTQAGARAGATVLAANAILLQFVSTAAYFLDGFAHTVETLAGRAIGARDRAGLLRVITVSTHLALVTALAASVFIWLAGESLLAIMTTDDATRLAAIEFLGWAALSPLLGVFAFQLDGLFIGATQGVAMRKAMVSSTLGFLLLWWLLLPWGNHGLWAALCANYIWSAIALARHLPVLFAALTLEH